MKSYLNSSSQMVMSFDTKPDLYLIDGVEELIKDLYANKIELILASSASKSTIDRVFSRFQLDQYFSHKISGENFPKSKPDPAIFLHAAEIAKSEHDECIVIEDSTNGVEAAFCANLYCLGYKSVNSKNQNLEKQILITKQKADLDYYMQRAENEESHNEFVHNTSHYLRAIDKFAQMKDYESIIKIIGEIDNQMEEHEIVSFSNYHVLNVILSEKQKLADDNNINFDIFIEPGIILNMVEDIDLIAMMGNLLDNAFRAARDCKNERYVKLKIYMQDVLGFCVIKIINNFLGDIVMDGDRFISTKTEKGIHGLGISSVNKIAEKYGGFLSCKVSDNIFEAVLLLSTDK